MSARLVKPPDRYKALLERSDAELLAWDFSSKRPEDEPNMLGAAPSDISGAVVARQYQFRRRVDPPVRCRQCRKEDGKANHWIGFVIRLPDGSGLAVGKDCGRRHYGLQWTRLMNDFKEQRARQSTLASRQEVLNAWPKLKLELAAFQRMPATRRYDIAARSLEEHVPRFRDALLRQLIERGPDLVREERTRDYRAEERRNDERPVYVTTTKTVGVIAGASFITEPAGLEGRIAHLVRSLENRINDLSDETDNLSKRELSSKLSEVRRLLRRLQEAAACLSAYSAFIAPGNLRTLCDWLTEQRPGDGRYSFNGMSVQWMRPDGTSGAWVLQTVSEPTLPTLANLIGLRQHGVERASSPAE